MTSFRAFFVALCIALLSGCATVAPQPPTPIVWPSVQYLQSLQSGIDRTRAQMPAITRSAEVAAKRVVGGYRIYIAGSQPEFAAEFLDRAGGMNLLAPLPRLLNRGDVVLYAARSKLSIGDRILIDRWRGQGAYVIAFASEALSADPYFQPDVLIDSGPSEGLTCLDGKICPTDSVINIMNAWTWTGEFVAACTRMGRMPVMSQAVGIPGGRARGEWYRGKAFHDDLKIKPVAAGILGKRYLDFIEDGIGCIAEESPPSLKIAGGWLQNSPPERCVMWATANMFPEHFADPRAPQPFGKVNGVQINKTPAGMVALVLGYQDAPQIAIDSATVKRTKLLYTSAQRGAGDGRDGIYFIDPHWPMTDACVTVKGYDIPILPASGVMQAAVYWSTLAEAFAVPTVSGQPMLTLATPGEK